MINIPAVIHLLKRFPPKKEMSLVSRLNTSRAAPAQVSLCDLMPEREREFLKAIELVQRAWRARAAKVAMKKLEKVLAGD